MSDLTKVGRLALRQEGQRWNAYYALPDTMDGAVLLGSLSMQIAVMPQHKHAFMDLMRGVVGDLMQSACGVRPQWKEPYVAPEHERSGNA